MRLINSITGQIIDIASDQDTKVWINSTTPWQLHDSVRTTVPEKPAEHPQLIHDILQWSEEKLPLWQRDALRRLFQYSGELSDESYSELYLMLKDRYGIKGDKFIFPDPLTLSHLPAITRLGEKVTLNAVRNFENVNRIAREQELKFSESGMTVIYGGNGTGKSGYVRVLKSVCRTRGKDEEIIPDATDNTFHVNTPAATFDLTANGSSRSISWASDIAPPEDLAKMSVFDTKCARASLTEEQEVAFLPYGLDIIEKLTNVVLPEISKRFAQEFNAIDVDPAPFGHLLGDTRVANLISTLNPKSEVDDINRLACLSEDESRKLVELNTALSVADPATKAKELSISVDRIKEFVKKIDRCNRWVCDEAISKLQGLNESVIKSSKAAKLAAETLRSGEDLLPGTGDEAWKALFNSAKRFSTEVAYPECDFPHVDEDAVCPLCQQDIISVTDRLIRFDEYIQADIAKQVKADREELNTVIDKIKQANLDICSEQAIIDELIELDPSVEELLISFRDSIKSRQQWMISAGEAEDKPILTENPRKKIRQLAAGQLRSHKTYRRAVDEDKKELLVKERDELAARSDLSKCVEGVKSLLNRIKDKALLKECEKDLKTQSLSRKAKELASSAVTSELKMALDKEFVLLGIGHVKTKLQDRNVKGKVKHQLLLDLPSNVKLDAILSEGEQRAIALGSFLADLHIANHSCGIIFDDPVSSLDHVRRRKVAKRLATEALLRQVIVFTHDAIFLSDLRSECENIKVECCCQYLEQANGYYGNVSIGLPWVHKSYGDRINKLETELKLLMKSPWPEYPSEELSSRILRQYNLLRATIERCIEEVVLGKTVQRFDSYIRVKNLSKVIGLEQFDVEEIVRLTNRCHDLIDAHDPSSARNDPPPTPEELRQDIDDLKKVLQRIKDR